jgi:hypothetical protein
LTDFVNMQPSVRSTPPPGPRWDERDDTSETERGARLISGRLRTAGTKAHVLTERCPSFVNRDIVNELPEGIAKDKLETNNNMYDAIVPTVLVILQCTWLIRNSHRRKSGYNTVATSGSRAHGYPYPTYGSRNPYVRVRRAALSYAGASLQQHRSSLQAVISSSYDSLELSP